VLPHKGSTPLILGAPATGRSGCHPELPYQVATRAGSCSGAPGRPGACISVVLRKWVGGDFGRCFGWTRRVQTVTAASAGLGCAPSAGSV